MGKTKDAAPIVSFRQHSGRGAIAIFNVPASNILNSWANPKCALFVSTQRIYFSPDLTAPGAYSFELKAKKDGTRVIYSAVFREMRLIGKRYRLHYCDNGAVYINRYKPLE